MAIAHGDSRTLQVSNILQRWPANFQMRPSVTFSARFVLTGYTHNNRSMTTIPITARRQVERHDRIRLASRGCALSQVQLARRLDVQRSAVANWESGASSPSSAHREHLARVLDVTNEWLATGRGEMALPFHRHNTP